MSRIPISIELLLISLVQLAIVIGSIWLITEPDTGNTSASELYYKVNFYTAMAYGFFLVFAIIGCVASQQVGFGFIMVILSGVFFGELMRNTLSVQDRVDSTINVNNNRIFVVSNLVTISSMVFAVTLMGMFFIERLNIDK